jgi:hypothetical protein
MKLFAALLVSFALLGFVSVAQAAKGGGKKGAGAVNGAVASVAADSKSITVKVKDKATNETKEVVVAVDDNTKYTLDGADAKLADIKAGHRVKVTPATGTATKVEATAAKGKKNK